jgi:hypothetical protein
MEVYQINAAQRDTTLDSELAEVRMHFGNELIDVKSRIRDLELSNAKNISTKKFP